jgi:hypothetical protein
LDEKALAEKREVEARTDVSLIDAGVLSPEEVRERIAADPESPHASIDVEEVPDLRAEEQEGLDPKAGGGQRGIGRAPHEEHEPSGNENENENDNHGDEGEDDEPDELTEFERRVQERADRHERKEGDFYDRARARTERNQRGETPFHERARARSKRAESFLHDRIEDRRLTEEAAARSDDAPPSEESIDPQTEGAA